MKLTYQKNKLMILSFIISLIVVFYRRPDAFYNPQFWDEERTVFFFETYKDGFNSLFNTCAGYYHLYPRLVASICNISNVSLSIIPFIYCYSWLFILALLIWFVWKRLPLDEISRFFVSIAIVLIPLQSEVFMNQTNVQWIMALFPLIIFASTDLEKNKKWFYFDVVILNIIWTHWPKFYGAFAIIFYFNDTSKKTINAR